MNDPCCEYTVFGGLVVNESDESLDRLWTGNTEDAITGLNSRPLRQQYDPKGVASGANLHDAYWNARIIVFRGEVQIVTADYFDDPAGYRAAYMALQSAWETAWAAALNTTFTLGFTPEGQGAQSLDVKIFDPVLSFGGTLKDPSFAFGLISAED